MVTPNYIRILLVEDNQDEAILIQEMLRSIIQPTYKVTHKTCLADAINYVNQNNNGSRGIDIVLLDLHLPDGSRFELFEHFSNQVPWVPIILLTNLDDEELALRIVRNGGQDYLLKSELKPKYLTRTIRYAIE